MSEYREDLGAMRERVESLEAELAAAKRSLDEARTVAGVHERSAETLTRQLSELRPRRGERLRAAGFGLVCGVVLGAIVAQRQSDRLQQVKVLAKQCDESLRACEQACAHCDR